MAENKKDKKTKSSDKNNKSIDKKEKKTAEKKAEPKSKGSAEATKAAKVEKEKAPKPPMSDEKKQNIFGLAVIGIITAALLISGMIGVPDNSIPTADNSSVAAEVTEDDSLSDGVTTTAAPSDADSSEDMSDSTTTTAAEDTSSETDETSQESPFEPDSTETEQQPQVTEAPDAEPQVTEAPSATKTTTTTKAAQTQPTTQTTTTTTTTTTAKKPSSPGGLSVRCSASNSWESEGSTFTQVDIYVRNDSSSDVSGWTVKITVPSGAEVSQQWNGDYSISGTTLTVKPADYNSDIGAGQEVNAGCIIRASGTFTPSASVQ